MSITQKELLAHKSQGPLSKVRAAREILRERAIELIESYISLAAEAKEAGKFDVASEILWKLIDHIPKEDLEGIIDAPSSKPVQVSDQENGPRIQIGIALGGLKTTKELPSTTTIDILPGEVK